MEYSAKNATVTLQARPFTGRGLLSLLRVSITAHRALWFLIPYATLLIFSGIGDSVLQVDEGADTFISTTILKTGLPRHSDGINATMLYADVRDGLFVYRTWVPYYLQAASIALFGKTAFAARLPFALAGLFSVVALYFLALKWSGRKVTAFTAALFLASSVPTLIYFRTARYIALPILWTPLLLYFYTQIFDKKKWNPLPFTATSILFFHTMYVEFAGVVLGMAVHFYSRRGLIPHDTRKKLWISAAVVALFSLPWMAFIYPVFATIAAFYHSTSELIDSSALGLLKHFAAFLFQANNYIYPIVLLPLLLLKSPNHPADPVRLCLITIVTVFATASLHSIPLHQYAAAALPLFFFLLAFTVCQCFSGGPILKASVAAILIGTNLLHVGPLLPFKILFKPEASWVRDNLFLHYASQTFQREVSLASYLNRYSHEIRHRYRGPLDELVDFFKTNGKPGQTCYIDNEPDALAFHTGMRVLSSETVNENHRPDWIVLRGDRLDFRNIKSQDRVSRTLKAILKSHPYREIPLNIAAGRINNSYDVQLHRFQSRNSADKVTVFRLQQEPSKPVTPPT